MVFCNIGNNSTNTPTINSHNPYFNRWFSAIKAQLKYYPYIKTSHNPYFNRWFSAI